jgi:hypothetical protein
VVQACNKPLQNEPKWEHFVDIHGDIHDNLKDAQESYNVLKLYESAIVRYRLIRRTEELVEIPAGN